MQANLAGGVWLATFFTLLASIFASEGNVRAYPQLVGIAAVVNLASFFFACSAYAKAKGYSGFVGFLLSMLSFFGLLILVVLKDKHPQRKSQSIEERSGT